ncbi:porin family protein [Rufibacter ruber]|uniref:porin family protein n=1 Tax=Rufibacter ruber TaxID=1783499 RepID=UPI000AE65420|nr:porin family protein [Rufibacter ruber]
MKTIRYSILFCLVAILFLGSRHAEAQVEIGVKFAPSITSNRTLAQDKYNFEGDGVGGGFGVGVMADYFFGANYAVSSGLMYNIKGGTVRYSYTQPIAPGALDGATSITMSGEDDLSLQYLEIPIALKLFTNEISTDTKLYFQAGGSLNTMLAAKVNDKKVDSEGDKFTKRFNLFEIDVLIGVGVERQIGVSTKLFGGITYHRGLTDVDDDHYAGIFKDDKVELKNDVFSLDFGIKF